jgi:phage FluMu gp28-like protein
MEALNMLKKIIATAVVLTSASAFAIPDGFTYLTSTEDMDIYYGSVLSKGGRDIFITTHEVYKDQSTVVETTVISEVDCSNPQARTVARVIYFADGKRISTDSSTPPGQWTYAGKGTAGARLYEKVCGHYPK